MQDAHVLCIVATDGAICTSVAERTPPTVRREVVFTAEPAGWMLRRGPDGDSGAAQMDERPASTLLCAWKLSLASAR